MAVRRLMAAAIGIVCVTGAAFWQVQASAEEEDRPEKVVRAQDLLPLQQSTRSFEVIDGDRRGEELPLTLRRTESDEPGEWVLTFDDLNRLYLRTDPDGHVLIVRLDLPAEDFAITYDPPVRLLPAEVRPHVGVDEESAVRVYSLEAGELEHDGQATHTVGFASRSEFSTPVGAWQGYLVPIEHEIELDQAEIRIDLAVGYVVGIGIVYRRMDYTRESFFGVFGETRRRAAILAEEP